MVEISVIIPVYNAEKYIRKCVDSILNQSFVNYELILVDDGSCDDTGIICDRIKESNPEKSIIVIHKENGGSASARNCGLSMAKGAFISFIDADDYIEKSFLDKMYMLQKKYNADIVQCDFTTVSKYENKREDKESTCTIKSKIDFFIDFCDRKAYVKTVVLWNKLFNKKLFEDLYIQEGKSIDDEYVILELIKRAEVIIDISDRLYYYFQSDNSQMRSKYNIKKLIDSLEVIDYQYPILKEFVPRESMGLYYYRACRGLLDNKYYLKKSDFGDSALHERINYYIKLFFPKVFFCGKVRFCEKIFILIQFMAPGIIWKMKRGSL